MCCCFCAGYNIDSLVVGRTEVEELSRMTVVVNGTAQSVINVRMILTWSSAATGEELMIVGLCR